MENKIHVLASGKELTIQLSSFEVAWGLSQTLLETVKKCGIELTPEILSSDDLMNNTDLINMFIKAFLEAITNQKVQDVFWQCASSCLYDGTRITKKLFMDDVSARGDLYEIQFMVLKENVAPFFRTLLRN